VKNFTDHSEIYLNFLRISGDLRKSPAYPQLDLPEERLLDLLAMFWSSGKKNNCVEGHANVFRRIVYNRSSAVKDFAFEGHA